MPKYNFTKEQENEIIEFYLKPNSVKDTMEYFNCSRFIIDNILQKYNITKHDTNLQKKLLEYNISLEEWEQEIINYYKSHSDNNTAKKFNIHINPRLFSILDKYNIPHHTKEENKQLTKARKQEWINKMKAELGYVPGWFGSPENDKILIEKYGTTNIMSLSEFKEKQKQTCKEKYGTEYYLQTEDAKQKTKETCQEKYGVNHPNQRQEAKDNISNKLKNKTKEEKQFIKEKIKQTNLKKYGYEYAAQVPKIREKQINTLTTKYGGCGLASQKIKEKVKQTNIEKYGVENPFQVEEFKEKIKQTNLQKYGVECYLQTHDCKEKAKQINLERYGMYHSPRLLYIYQDIYFDSFPELCLYMYCINNNIHIIREPVELSFEFEGKISHYYPDFLVENQLIEIKGDHFLTENNTWYNPFDHSEDKLFEAKYQCAIQNNVKILYNKDYQKYIDWFNAQGYKKEGFIIK